MFAITGATGKVGGAAARALLADNKPVRVVLRDGSKGAAWQAQNCEVAIADMEDASALAASFDGCEGIFILPPPMFDPSPGYPEARRVIDAVVAAIALARPKKIVCLSTVGADTDIDNLLAQRRLMEQALDGVDVPVTFLRAAWFMENAQWDVAAARTEGVLRSFLNPPERAVPMVATQDVGRAAAALLSETWTGKRIVNLQGPCRVSPNDLAAAFARAFGKPVRVETVPRDTWETLFRAQGMRHPLPRMRMLDGFNQGWITFDLSAPMRRGATPLDAVIADLVGP